MNHDAHDKRVMECYYAVQDTVGSPQPIYLVINCHYILSTEEDGVYIQSNRYCCPMMGIPEREVLDMKIKTKKEVI